MISAIDVVRKFALKDHANYVKTIENGEGQLSKAGINTQRLTSSGSMHRAR